MPRDKTKTIPAAVLLHRLQIPKGSLTYASMSFAPTMGLLPDT